MSLNDLERGDANLRGRRRQNLVFMARPRPLLGDDEMLELALICVLTLANSLRGVLNSQTPTASTGDFAHPGQMA